jgi:hypothetical protein
MLGMSSHVEYVSRVLQCGPREAYEREFILRKLEENQKRLVRAKARWLRCDRRFVTASFHYSSIDGAEWVGCFSAHRQHFGPGRGQWVVLTSESRPDDSRLVRL